MVREIASPAAGIPPVAPAAGGGRAGEPAARAAPIEIEQGSNGLCPAIENAALLFASDQAAAARALLEDAIEQDPEARGATLAWLGLFDLLRRANDRGAFDQLALQYVVQFERSAPSWEELGGPGPDLRQASGTGSVVLNGKVTAASSDKIEALQRIAGDPGVQGKLDLGGVTGYDDAGARLLAAALGKVRRSPTALVVERAAGLRGALESAANQGREAGEGAWLLLLELLQWQGEQAAFDDRAVEYAVTHEVSPPSWEPPVRPGPTPPAKRSVRSRTDADVLAWAGEIKGPAPKAVAELVEFGQSRSNVLLDMAQVERIDFVSGGALANVLQRMANGRRTVQLVGATPMVRALLLLVGVSGELFARKVA